MENVLLENDEGHARLHAYLKRASDIVSTWPPWKQKVLSGPTSVEKPIPTQYVAGLVFSKDREFVVLIRKNRPAWQAGQLNGVGGHIEEDETPIDAMRREFREETGVNFEGFEFFATLVVPTCTVHWFKAFVDDMVLTSTTDEDVDWYNVDRVIDPNDAWGLHPIPNLRWIIPLALDTDNPTAIVMDHAAYKH